MTDTTEMNNILSRMPWTRAQLTREQFDAWLASRKEASRVIDIETCEIATFYANYFDPYGTYPFDDDDSNDPLLEQCRDYFDKCLFVCSEESDGWIAESDLSAEKQQSVRDRIAREQRLLRAACAAHPMWKAVGMFWKWIGEYEAPSGDAMIKWFKVSYPAQAREVEDRAQDQDVDRRIVVWHADDEIPF